MRALLAWSVLIATATAAVVMTGPPDPRTVDAPVQSFSAGRAFEHVERIAIRPHPAHSAANAEVREYIVSVLRGLGFQVEVHTRVSPTDKRPLRNIVAKRPGHASTGVVMLACHYDSALPLSHGAADDGAAVAAVLETGRAIAAGAPLQNDLWFLITDAEESGLLGAWEFARQNPDIALVDVVFNFEARGTAGRSLMFQTSPGNRDLVEAYAEFVPRPSACSLMDEFYRIMPRDTDFTVFLRHDLKGMNFAFVEEYRNYHTPNDDPDHLSLASLQHHGEAMLALSRHYGERDLRAVDHTEEVVYFDLLAYTLVVYPATWVWPLTIFAVLVLALALAVALRRGDVTWGALGVGAYATFRSMAYAAIVVGGFAFLALTLAHSRMTGPVPGSTGDGWFYAGMCLIAVAVATATTGTATARRGFAATAAAPLLVSALLLVAVSVWLVGATFALMWPLVLLLAAWCASLRIRRDGLAAIAALVYIVPVVLLLAPLEQLLFVGLALPQAIVHAPLLGLWLAAVAPLLDREGGGWRRPVVVVPAVAGVLVFGIGFFA